MLFGPVEHAYASQSYNLEDTSIYGVLIIINTKSIKGTENVVGLGPLLL